jgi:hypothetical protein
MSVPALASGSNVSASFATSPILASAGQTYTIKLLTNQVAYVYDGHLGSTDTQWYYPQKWEWHCSGWYNGMAKVIFVGKSGWAACAYNEGAYNVATFDASTPNYPRLPNLSYFSTAHQTADMASDGKTIYLMEWKAVQNNNFVTAIDAGTSMPFYFTNGTYDTTFIWPGGFIGNNNYVPTLTGTYIDLVVSPATDVQTGIAVQQSGSILAVAHGTTGTIKLFDKVSGSSVGTISGVHVSTITPNFTPMAFTTEGLWYVSDGGLYLITGLPSSPVVTQPIAGPPFQYVAAIGANPTTNGLYVADGGTNQQIYEYAVNTHLLLKTLGVLGGYHDCNPTITHTRFMFDDTATIGSNAAGNYFHYVFVQPDASDNVWVEDLYGRRIQHFDASGNYVNQILYMKPSYGGATASETMPTRTFIGMFEYDMNYTVPNLPGDPDPTLGGNGSWTFAKDWMVCALGAHGSPPLTDANQDRYYFLQVENLSNNRVYATLTSHPGNFRNVFELPVNGTSPARNTGLLWPNNYTMLRNGTLSSWSVSGSSPSKTVSILNEALTGFDGSGNPIWGSPATVISTTTNASNVFLIPGQGGIGGSRSSEPTTSGYYPIWQTSVIGTSGYPHAAAIKSGFPSYAWTTMPEKALVVPDGMSYPSGASAGMTPVRTEGTNILYWYAGNYNAYGSQVYHYYEDGLMIGQFGNTTALPPNGEKYPLHPGNIGNSQYMSTTTVNGDIYVYLGDEALSLAQRWHVANLNSIHEYAGTGVLQPGGSVILNPLF